MDRFLRPVGGAGVVAAAALLWLAACAGGGGAGDDRLAPDRGAALARIVVDNRTERTLVIAFRYALPPGGRVEVGRVGPRTAAELAPVPAQEPIILEAIGGGLERRLPPRVLEIDRVWTWVIADSTSDGR